MNAFNPEVLKYHLVDYRNSLASQEDRLRIRLEELTRSHNILRENLEGRWMDSFTPHFHKSVRSLEEYLTQTRRMIVFLDEKIRILEDM